MRPRLTAKTKKALTGGGVGVGSCFGVVAGGADHYALILIALSVFAFAIAAFGALAGEDIRKFHRLSIRDATFDDLDRFHAQLAEFTAAVVPLDERHAISKKNSGCFRIIEDIRDKGEWRRTLDILALYPLNEDTTKKVLNGVMRGSDIRSANITKSFVTASGVYISFAEGRTVTTRGLLIHELVRVIGRVRTRPLPIITIPTTPLALAVVKNRGFTTLNGQQAMLGEVCVHNLS